MPSFKRVCLIGSLKFLDDFNRIESALKNEGIPCIKPVVYRDNLIEVLDDIAHPEKILQKSRTPEEEIIGTKMHIANVAISDIVYVINRGGYVGRSTAVEIGVAWALNKEIFSMEKVTDPSVELLVRGGVVSLNGLIDKIKSGSSFSSSSRF